MSKSKIAGWVLSGLLAAFLIVASAGGKFLDWEGKEEAFAKAGYTVDLMYKIGIVEVIVTLLFLVPRTAFVGAILLTGYLGGATETHVRSSEPFFIPIVIGVIAWICLGLRDPRVFSVALGTSPVREKGANPS